MMHQERCMRQGADSRYASGGDARMGVPNWRRGRFTDSAPFAFMSGNRWKEISWMGLPLNGSRYDQRNSWRELIARPTA